MFIPRWSLLTIGIIWISTACTQSSIINKSGEIIDQSELDSEIFRIQPDIHATSQFKGSIEGADATEMFVETSITQKGDGTLVISQRQITLAEEISDRESEAQREATLTRGDVHIQTLVPDGTCSSSSLRLFDQTNFLGNKICFSGTGAVDLSAFSRAAVCLGARIGKWFDFFWQIDPRAGCVSSFIKSNQVRSLIAGQFRGGMDPSDFNVCQRCAVWEANTSIPDLPASGCSFVRTGPPAECVH